MVRFGLRAIGLLPAASGGYLARSNAEEDTVGSASMHAQPRAQQLVQPRVQQPRSQSRGLRSRKRVRVGVGLEIIRSRITARNRCPGWG